MKKVLLLVGILLSTVCAHVGIAGVPCGIVPLPAGYSMVANPCDGTGLAVADFLPAPPDGTIIYKLIGTVYEVAQFYGGWEGDAGWTLLPGEGAYIYLPGPAAVGFSGVPLLSPQLIGLPAGWSIRSPPAGLGMVGFPAGDGDYIYRYNEAIGGWDSYGFFDGFWLPEEPAPGIGEAFWVFKVAPAVWLQ